MAIRKFFTAWNRRLCERADLADYPYKLFGIFGFITYPLYYFLWDGTQGYGNLVLRVVAAILCVPLIFARKWADQLRPYLPIYWYFTLLYCLPFLFSFFTLQNHMSFSWVLNCLTVIVLSILLLDTVAFLIITVLGVSLGYMAASFVGPIVISNEVNPYAIEVAYFSVVLFGTLFASNRKQMQSKRLLIKEKEVSEAKSTFIANMSHDLRTPMTGVMGMLTEMECLATDAVKEPSKAAEYAKETIELAKIGKSSANQLLDLFNETIETMKLGSDDVVIEEGCFSLDKRVQKSIDLLASAAREKGLDVRKNIAEKVPVYLKGGAHNLDRILANLVSNALKFTKEGWIEISADQVSGGPSQVGDEVIIRICVSDTGIGIPKDKHEAIFEHFSRINPSYEGNYKGNGLGLYAVKQYVESMNGTISVESEEGKGSQFIVDLPFEVADHSDQEESVSSEPTPQATGIACTAGGTHQPTQHGEEKPVWHPSHIEPASEIVAQALVVEDNTAAALSIKRALTRLNCESDHAKTGEESVDCAKSKQYDIIFMDIGLPGISGLEATEKIRGFSSVPIIAVTGHVDKAGVCIDAGMQELLAKPATPSSLEAMLNRHVLSQKEDMKRLNDGQTIIDWSCCKRMHEGDEAITTEIMDMTYEEILRSEAVIDAAYAQKNSKQLRDEMHRVRGGICYLRLPQLERAAKDFHLTLKEGLEVGENMDREYQNLKRAIKSFKEVYEQGDYKKGSGKDDGP